MTDGQQMQVVIHRYGSQDNMYMWGKLYVYKPAQTVAGWLVDSWSEGGAPYWQPEIHWLDKNQNKVWRVELPTALERIEDKDIDPARAKFIRTTVDQWEQEWFDDGAKLP